MTTISTRPEIPVPKRRTTVLFVLSQSTSNYLRVWVTAAPDDSALKTKLDSSALSRYEVTTELKEIAGSYEWTFTPDQGGRYVLAVQEYDRREFRGGFSEDPDGRRRDEPIGSEEAPAIQVAQRMVNRLQIPLTPAVTSVSELILYTQDTTIVATSVDAHGEASPALVAVSADAATKQAVKASAVLTGLAALAGIAASTAIGDWEVIVGNEISELNQHGVASGVHDSNDSDNDIGGPYLNPRTEDSFVESVNVLLVNLRYHMTNDGSLASPAAPGIGEAAYHAPGGGGSRKTDWENLPVFRSIRTMSEVGLALADYRRAFEGHRLSTDVHTTADTVNGIDALPPLLALYETLLTDLVDRAPPAPATENAGAVTLVRGAGFEESPL